MPRTTTTDPDQTELYFCDECGDRVEEHELYDTAEGSLYLCESCESRWMVCDSCGEMTRDTDIICVSADQAVCEDCLGRHYTECRICGETVHNDNIRILSDGDPVCEECLENDCAECQVCGYTAHVNDLTDDRGAWLCQRCHDEIEDEEAEEVFRIRPEIPQNRNTLFCDSCRDEIQPSEIHALNNVILCPRCFAKYERQDVVHCDGCGMLLKKENASVVASDNTRDYYACDGCKLNFRHVSRNLNNYSFRPYMIFHRTSAEQDRISKRAINPRFAAYYGLELEVVAPPGISNRETIKSLGELYGKSGTLLYCKHDSSVSGGFEIVTHPCTLSYHQNELPWDGILEYMRDKEYESQNTSCCGLHVHLSKNLLSATDKIKFGLFLNMNKDNMIILARRRANGFCTYEAYPAGRLRRAAVTADRYSAVNWQPRSTVEVRVFRGTLDPDVVIATVELVDAVRSFIQTVSVNTIASLDAGWPEFLQYVSVHSKTYKRLFQYMDDRGKNWELFHENNPMPIGELKKCA